MLKTQEMWINFGPQHPSTHGVFRMELKLDGETVVDCIPHFGYLHRAVEKLAESRTYPQFIPFTDRMDYLASMNNNQGYCEAVEKLMGLEVPERAQYIRIIVQELNRIASHLVFYGSFGLDTGAITPFLYAFREREKIVDLFESISGQRLTYNYIRIGGVMRDLPEGFLQQTAKVLNDIKLCIDEFNNLLTYNEIFLERTKGIAVLGKENAINFGITGPMLRASNFKWDLRKDEPYCIYPRFNFDIPVGTNGDCWDRYVIRLKEIEQSIKIIEQAIIDIPESDTVWKAPRIIKPPAGEVYHRIENPRGELGYYVISDGTQNPYRIKVRAPSFINLQALPFLVKGYKVADAIIILGSIDIVVGETDR